MPIYNVSLLSIDPVETKRYAGLRYTKDFDDENIINACEDAQLLIEVKSIWEIYNYDYKNQIVLSKPNVIISGKSIGKHLLNCDKVACIAATVGEKIENEISYRFESGKYLDSILLDAAATTAVEQVANSMEEAIKQKVSHEGYNMRWRFSPGYGDWSLEQQLDLYKLSGAEKIGIKLSTAMMMTPRKSITAIIGLYKNELSNKNNKIENYCTNCNKNDCQVRKF